MRKIIAGILLGLVLLIVSACLSSGGFPGDQLTIIVQRADVSFGAMQELGIYLDDQLIMNLSNGGAQRVQVARGSHVLRAEMAGVPPSQSLEISPDTSRIEVVATPTSGAFRNSIQLELGSPVVSGAPVDRPTITSRPSGSAPSTASASAPALPEGRSSISFSSRQGALFSLVLNAPAQVQIYTEGSMDTVITILNADTRNVIQEDDDSGDNYNARLNANLNAGRYLVSVAPYDASSGSCTLVYIPGSGSSAGSSSGSAPAESAEAITPGRYQLGFTSGNPAWFSFQVTGRVLVTLATEGRLDTVMTLFGPNSQTIRVAEDDDSGSDSNARIETLLSTPGTYFLQIRPYSSGTVGQYVLSYQTANPAPPDRYEPNNSRDQATRLGIGETQEGHSLSRTDGVDWFVVEAPQSGRYVLGTRGSLDTLMTLYNSRNAQVASADDNGSDKNARLELYLERGTYYVEIKAYNGAAGQYSIYVTPGSFRS
ncbi:MAG: PPC domain-containing protein [Spirochaetales bacterium]|nr:PPC domain-containing protein [Spirochaetales bacterium]